MKKLSFGLGIMWVLFFSLLFAGTAEALSYPTGVPRCQITEPNSGGYFYLAYPLPANHSTTISEQIRKAPGEEDPTTLPVKEFKLSWSSLVDRPNEQSKNDPLFASDGYAAELSSDASGNDGVSKIENKSIPLAGSMQVKIKNDPIKYTITVKKNGSAVANCSVSVKHNVNWIDVYKPPEDAKPTGNNLFPYRVKDLLGTDYVNRPFPTPAEYSSPIKKFVGRYYDVAGSQGRFVDWGNLGYWPGFAGIQDKIGETPNHLVVPMSASILGYKKSTLISRLGSEPLLFFRGNVFRGKYEDAFIPWDTILQQDPGKSGMYLHYDEPCRLTVRGMDVDDRGYIYFSSANCAGGLIIARDNGSAIVPMLQILSPETAKEALSNSKVTVKVVSGGTDVGNGTPKIYKSGGSYYLAQTEGKKTAVFNVTDPFNPTLHRADSGSSMQGVQSGDIIANQSAGGIAIYQSSDFISGLAPKKEFSIASKGGYKGLVADKVSGRFFAVSFDGTNTILSVFAPGVGKTPASYTETKHVIGAGDMRINKLSYDSGFLSAVYVSQSSYDLKFWVFQSGKLVELKTNLFYKKYYGQGWINPATGKTEAQVGAADISIHNLGGKDYLFISTSKYGDVYELEPVPREGYTGVTPVNPVDNGCGSGTEFSTTTGDPCVCVLKPPFALGTKSEAVKELQQQLKDGGFYKGKVDGTYGPLTNAAALAQCKSVKNPKYTIPAKTSTPPVITKIEGPTSLKVNQQGVWTALATDKNNDDLSWSVNWGAGRSAQSCQVNPPAGTAQNWTYTSSHSWDKAGTYTVTIYVSDCKGGTAKKSVTVRVS